MMFVKLKIILTYSLNISVLLLFHKIKLKSFLFPLSIENNDFNNESCSYDVTIGIYLQNYRIKPHNLREKKFVSFILPVTTDE